MLILLFFFQAEDGIRDRNVTGVQTCALPISCSIAETAIEQARFPGAMPAETRRLVEHEMRDPMRRQNLLGARSTPAGVVEIGRASCRERGWVSVVAGAWRKKREGGDSWGVRR